MARFSFGAGNAAKLLRAPLMVVGRLMTAVIPRSRDQWVFGSAFGLADGGFALYRRTVDDGIPAIWLSGSGTEASAAAAARLRTARKSSLAGFWHTARARVIVITHGFGDVNRYATSGALIVQLWHGIPLKRIGLDSPQTAALPPALGRLPGVARAVRAAYRWSSRRIDVIPAASPLARGRLESAFALRETAAVVTGEPRVDLLSAGDPAERRRAARAVIESAVGPVGDAPVILYAPTWRDGATDPGVPTEQDWRTIDAMLRGAGALLLIRSHPLGAGSYAPPPGIDSARVRSLAQLPDILPALAGCDVLVTDYSSVLFEAGLLPIPVVFFAPDLAEYAASRGLYGRYSEIADEPVTGWPAAADRIERILTDPETRRATTAHAEQLARATHTFADGGNTERLYRLIRRRLGHEVDPAANLVRYLIDGQQP